MLLFSNVQTVFASDAERTLHSSEGRTELPFLKFITKSLWPKAAKTPLKMRLHFVQIVTVKFITVSHKNSPTPSGRHIPLLTELETSFDFGFYKYAAPDGAPVCESQRDENHSAKGCAVGPSGSDRAALGHVPPMFSTLKALHPIRRGAAFTPLRLTPAGTQRGFPAPFVHSHVEAT